MTWTYVFTVSGRCAGWSPIARDDDRERRDTLQAPHILANLLGLHLPIESLKTIANFDMGIHRNVDGFRRTVVFSSRGRLV